MSDEQRRRTGDESTSASPDADDAISHDETTVEESTADESATDGSETSTSDGSSTGSFGVSGLIQPPDFSPDGVPKHVAVAFWTVVVVVNAAVLALSLGPLLILFEGRWLLGGGLFVLGIALAALAYWRYREFRREQAERAESEDDDEDEEKVFAVVPERGLPDLDDRASARDSHTENASDPTRNR